MPAAAHPFFIAFAATLAVVALAAVLGRAGRRRPHVVSAIGAGTCLGYAVYLAEMLGRVLVIPRAELIVHLVFANAATVAFVAVVVTGGRLLRRDGTQRRTWHRRAVVAFILLTLVAACTGTYMLSRSTPRSVSAALSGRRVRPPGVRSGPVGTG